MEHPFWIHAKKAAKLIGWFPEVVLTQWMVETGHFKSNNFKKNNNIAGQTWHEGLPESMKGTARPKEEGGYYIKYKDAVDGYVDFVLKNRRYRKVKDGNTVEEQFKLIKQAGWAVDPNYVDTLMSVHLSNIKKDNYHTDKPKPKPTPILNTSVSIVDYLKSKGKPTDSAYRRSLAKEMGMSHYSGNAEDNLKLLAILKRKWK